MTIETMSVNPEALTIAINGEGYKCAPERFPKLDPNIASLHWHPHKSRCKGAVSYHKGVGHGLDDFSLLQPFVTAWEDARERTLARKAMAQAEAAGEFDREQRAEAARKAQEEFEAHREERAREQARKDAERRQEIVTQVIQQLGGTLPEGTPLLPAQEDARIPKLESDLASVATAVADANRLIAEQLADIALRLQSLESWGHLIEAMVDPAPTVAAHPEAAQLLGLKPASDGDKETWLRAHAAIKEAGR